jgi:predicted lipase
MITHCTDPQITNWSCKLCKSNVLTDVALIQNSTYDIAGYAGYSKAHDQIIVSWRGTVDTKNWEVDFRYKLTKYTPRSGVCIDCQIHTGILQAYRSVENQVNTHVKSLLAKYTTASITSTGHSLGGGLSLLTNLELQIAFPNKISYTYNYGCLRIGNGNFVNFLKSKITSIYRVVHNKDPVPHVPPFDFGYIHPANEIFYNEDMSSYTVCNDSG